MIFFVCYIRQIYYIPKILLYKKIPIRFELFALKNPVERKIFPYSLSLRCLAGNKEIFKIHENKFNLTTEVMGNDSHECMIR